MNDDPRVRPTAYRPPPGPPERPRHWRQPWPWAVAGVLLVFAGAAWFVFTAQAVTLQVRPIPESVAVRGGLDLPLGGRYLLRAGRYTVVADKTGYRQLKQTINVTASGKHHFNFQLKEKPGRLQVHSRPGGATVAVDGKKVGTTPLAAAEVEPGEHRVSVRARRYKVFHKKITIAGKNRLQTLDAELKPAWAPVTVSSQPPGATLRVDGRARGKTPVEAKIGAGEHRLGLRLSGYQTWHKGLTVVAGQPHKLAKVRLAKVRGHLALTSRPAGASISVDGDFRGKTPLTVDLPPDEKASLHIAKAGYKNAVRTASVASGATQQLHVRLQPILAGVTVHVQPADATVYVDGRARGKGGQTLKLTARAHKLSVRKPGYVTYRTRVTPKPGLTQSVTARLMTPAQAKFAKLPKTVQTPAGATLRLIRPGSFTMGAPRREQGARPNEVPRRVRLTKAFYLSEHEVTNQQFSAFRSSHSSGIVARKTLGNDDQPVVRVSWKDATAYCNWLSKRAGLPAAYRNGKLVTPVNTGYRLPTEAEWAWAARFAGARHLKYPWGNAMPPTGNAGNYADKSASNLVDFYLHHYKDGYAATAPVGRFAANALGVYDLGGNVAEWVNDRYSAGFGLGAKVEVNPTGPAQGASHVVRGSSWRDATITKLRLSYRAAADQPRDDLGFRLARYAE